MEKTKNAVKYMIDVWDEVTGRTWRDRPDHVEQKFLEAEKELSNMPIIFSEAELKAKLEEQLEETRQWLIDEGFELSINLALAGNRRV